MAKRRTETDILTDGSLDTTAAFTALYELYAKQIYSYCQLRLHSVNAEPIESIVQEVFKQAYKYVHKFNPQAGSFRLYLLLLAESTIRETHSQRYTAFIPYHHKQFTEIEKKHWKQICTFRELEHSVCVLYHGLKLTMSEVTVVLQESQPVIQEVLEGCWQQIDRAELSTFYGKWLHLSQTHYTHQRTLLKQILHKKKVAPTFARNTWWKSIMGPIPLGFVVIVMILVIGLVWYNIAPQPLFRKANTKTAAPAALDQNPSEFTNGPIPPNNSHLPVLPDKTSLITLTDNLYGTNYVHQLTTDTPIEAELKPHWAIDVPVSSFRSVEQAYTYTAPETYDESQLQLAAWRHFPSIPLNQFTYVNGTYYIQEAPHEFRPLFIAFNNNGAIEMQMRQAAICQLSQLTDSISDEIASQTAFDFLTAHHFLEVPESDVKTIRISADDRTVKKGTFCKSDDTTLVQDREIVVYPPPVLLHYGDGAQELLPLRLRGIAVQLHGNNVTNMRVDPLQTLREALVKLETTPLLSLSEAVIQLQQFYYPATDKTAEYQRFQRVFAQWNHLQGNERLNDIKIIKVRLEYVYDALRQVVEPYYVFTGTGLDVAGDYHDEVRFYVAAATKNLELRGPYRE